jgi:signal transduction histidine kinase
VLVIVLRHADQGGDGDYEGLLQLSHAVSAYIARGQAYDEAVDGRLQAETALRNKDEFLSVLSHELKNVMMPILGWAVALAAERCLRINRTWPWRVSSGTLEH